MLIFGGTAALFLLMTVSALWHLRWVHRLPALETLTGTAEMAVSANKQPVRCSVVIAARDEEARIEQTIRHLLAQRGVETEFIVVDDRSADRTGEILRRLAKEDARIQFKRVDVLPDGWLGKCHACHVGALEATGDWILFTDADCWLKPDVIERAVRVAQRDGADHVTLSPGTVIESLGARAWHLLFLTSLSNWFSGVNRDRAGSYIGIGAFNLVRAGAYRQCGGYEALRLTVVDDVKLGLLLRRAGRRTRAFLGVDDVECHWGTTVWSMVKIMEKNYFAALDFRLGLAIAGSVAVTVVFFILAIGLAAGTRSGLAAGFSPLSLVLPAAVLARRVGWTWPCAVLTPFMLPVFLYALLNSTCVTLRQGGVRWRETFYPLNALRAGNVR
ncbi:MAG TPA: glycosyltransferase family 2 protein [Candidatus Angelobacter sp.]|nr:glycosyltransferase family 2 protein [Candidatus Angelobacter sp.]